MDIGEDGKLRVRGYVTVDRSGSKMLDGGWSFSWDDCGVLDDKDTDVGKGMSLVGWAEDIRSKVVLKQTIQWVDSGKTCNFTSGSCPSKLGGEMLLSHSGF